MRLKNQIRTELKKRVDPVYKKGSQVVYKGEQSSTAHGVRVPEVRSLARQLYPQVKMLSKKELFSLVESLLIDDYVEEALIGFSWVWRRKNELEEGDFAVFERWVKRYLNNWPKVDDFCTHSLGFLLEKHPELMVRSFGWTRSQKRFVKRSAAVSLIYPVRQSKAKNINPGSRLPGLILAQVFRVAEVLLEDEDDLVQKGYGWMLKVAADYYQREVFEFVMKHKTKMPRTALRYAIEKMPSTLKKQAMN